MCSSSLIYRRQRGITLIELLTVIVVVSILVGLTVPTYRKHLIRSQRSDAMTGLLQLQAAEEKYYLQNNAYTNVAGLGVTGVSPHGFYTMSVTVPEDGQSYTATATPDPDKGQQGDSQCMNFTITDLGVKGVSGTGDPATCWR